MTDDRSEITELEAAAAWRLRKADAGDQKSAEAATLLQQIADSLRQMPDSPLWREYGAICNWLGESDDISDFAQLAHEYRQRIGVDAFPRDGEDYLRALLDIARRSFGEP